MPVPTPRPCEPGPELTAAWRAGCPAASERLVETLQPLARSICRSILGATAEADDACQNALIDLLEARDDIAGAPGAWLRTCARNHCLMALRRGRRARRVALDPDAHATTPTPDAAGDGLLEAVLEVLGPDQREQLVRHFLVQATSGRLPAALGRQLRRLRRHPRLRAWCPAA